MSPDLYTINCGNTNTSIGLFTKSNLTHVLELDEFKQKISSGELSTEVLAYSCQTKKSHEINQLRLKKLRSFPARTKENQKLNYFEMPIEYSETLGEDRLLIAHKVFYDNFIDSKSCQKQVLIIDAGTYLTVDLLDPKKGFLGGYIFPGLKLLLDTYAFGENLHVPAPTFLASTGKSVPKSTDEAITYAIKHMLISNLNVFSNLYEDLSKFKIILTGGDATTLKPLVAGASIQENLIHESIACAAKLMQQNPST